MSPPTSITIPVISAAAAAAAASSSSPRVDMLPGSAPAGALASNDASPMPSVLGRRVVPTPNNFDAAFAIAAERIERARVGVREISYRKRWDLLEQKISVIFQITKKS